MKIFLRNSESIGGSSSRIIALSATGASVTAFGTNGILPILYGGFTTASLRALADGSLFLVGTQSSVSTDTSVEVRKLTPTGADDTSFGLNGLAVINSSIGNGRLDTPFGIEILAGGKIAVAYQSTLGSLSENVDWRVVVLNPNGTLDASFGNSGERRIDLGPGSHNLRSLEASPTGELYLSGLLQDFLFDAGEATPSRIADLNSRTLATWLTDALTANSIDYSTGVRFTTYAVRVG